MCCEDLEDVIQLAFLQFAECLAENPSLGREENPHGWRLLLKIAKCRQKDLQRKKSSIKNGGKTLFESYSDHPYQDHQNEVVELFDELRSRLNDQCLFRILELRFNGYENDDIAQEMDLSSRTLSRKFAIIRDKLSSGI